MKRLVVWFALIALACAGAVSASTYTGYSDAFGIDNTAGDTRPRPPLAVADSPYDNNAFWPNWRVQLHCHSCNEVLAWMNKKHIPCLHCGDVWVPISDVADEYGDQGYDFVALTDHNKVSAPTEGLAVHWPGNSEEITTFCHVLGIDMCQADPEDPNSDLLTPVLNNDLGTQREQLKRILKKVHQRDGFAAIAHPDSSVVGFTVAGYTKRFSEDVPGVEYGPLLGALRDWRKEHDSQTLESNKCAPDAMAVYNSTGVGGQTFFSKWDTCLGQGYKIWAIAEDDWHPHPWPANPVIHSGRAWVGVPDTVPANWAGVKSSLKSGAFYAYFTEHTSWPNVEEPLLQITVSQTGQYPSVTATLRDYVGNPYSVNLIRFYGQKGKYLSEVSGSSATYTCDGTEKYVRVQVYQNISGGKLNIVSQPIFITPPPATSGMAVVAKGPHALSSSPELQLRYLANDEKPASPDGGYIGYVFDVTTDTGTLPPAATLQLSFDGEDTSAIGGTQYLAIYRYDDTAGAWVKIGGTVDPATATIETPITALGKYCISADLPVDTTAPQVWIDNPVLGGVVSSDTTVKATVNDDLGAWRVRFYMNGHLLAEDADSSDGWGADLKVSDYCTGDWTLKAEAEDLAGNVGTAEVPIYIASSTPLPTVTISSPGAGNVLNGTVTASGTCGDDVAVAAVALKVDDTLVGYGEVDGSNWTCQIDTTYLADGNRMLTATVEDYPGNTASATVPVVVNNAAATSPLGNAKNASEGAPIRFASAVVVADSSIVGDGFYAEAVNRTSGVKVLSGAGIHVGDSVSVVGSRTTIGHEAVVQAQDIAVISTGNTLPKPLATYATKLLLAPDSIGKIVKLWGTIGDKDTANPPAWFMLNDQSGVPVKCKLASGVTFDPGWTLIAVTGVVCTEDVSGAAQIDLLVTDSASIQPLE